MTSPGRRDVLRTAAAVPLAAVAGCTGVFGDEDERPPYDRGIPRRGADGDDGVFFVHLEWAQLREFHRGEPPAYVEAMPGDVEITLNPDRETPPIDVDPLVAYPVGGLFFGVATLGFGLLPYGFADDLLGDVGDEYARDPSERPTGTPDGSTTASDDATATPSASTPDAAVDVESILLVDGVGVFRGSFAAGTVVSASEDFAAAGERGDFELYEGTREGFLGTDGLAFAVRDDLLVALLDEDASLEPVLDALAGDVDRLDDDGDGEWALAEAGDGVVSVGAWGIDADEAAADSRFVDADRLVDLESVFGNATGVVSSLDFGPSSGRGSLAAVFPDGEAPSEADVGAEVGTSAPERDVTVDGDRVTVTGTWSNDDEVDDGDGDGGDGATPTAAPDGSSR